MRTDDIQRLMWRIYPYVRDELFLRWDEAEMNEIVVEALDDLVRDFRELDAYQHDMAQGRAFEFQRRPFTHQLQHVELQHTCRGSGRAPSSRTLQVRVPPGVKDGQRIRLKGKGEAGWGGAPAGDTTATLTIFDFGGDPAQGIGPFDGRYVRDNFRQAIQARDFLVVQVIVLLISFVYVMTSVLADLIYGLVDPRIRLE